MAVLKKIPDAENGSGVTCIDVHGQEWRIAQDPIRHKFTLYKIVEKGFERVAAADSPLDLYPNIDFGPEAAEMTASHEPPETEVTNDAKPKKPRRRRDKNPT